MANVDPNLYSDIGNMTYAETDEQKPTTSISYMENGSHEAIREDELYGLYDVATSDSKPATILREHAKEGTIPKSSSDAVDQTDHPANPTKSQKVNVPAQPQPSSQDSSNTVPDQALSTEPKSTNLRTSQEPNQDTNINNNNISQNPGSGGQANQDILAQLHPQNFYVDEVEMARLRETNNTIEPKLTGNNEASEQYAVPEYDRRTRNYAVTSVPTSLERSAEDGYTDGPISSASKKDNDSVQNFCSSPCRSSITVPKWAAIVVYVSIIMLTIVSAILIGLVADLREKYSDLEEKVNSAIYPFS